MNAPTSPSIAHFRKPGLDALALFTLVIARVRIDTLADLVAKRPLKAIQQLPIIPLLLPAERLQLLRDWLTDPVSQLLIGIVFGALSVYLVVDVLADSETTGKTRQEQLKLGLIWLIIVVTVILQSLFLVGLRHITGPAAFCHDGGVIQTEEAIRLLLAGRNPYVEDYTNTPLAEWGLEYKTALYHYPYLPWTFLFSAPFYLLSQLTLGWFDQRFVYLLLFILSLIMASRLTRRHRHRLLILMTLGLNPIMGSDIIFGMNDSFVLFWIILAVWLLARRPGLASPWPQLSAATLSLACASKPTAWLLVPFYLLYLSKDKAPDWRRAGRALVRRAWPLPVIFLLIVGPYLVWNADALYDDVWRWSSGTAQMPYQIRGWGLSNWALALGLVRSRLDYFPFWILELAISLPLLVALLWRQKSHNTLKQALWGYAVVLLVFFYVSRFLNENYLGYILAFLALAVFIAPEPD